MIDFKKISNEILYRDFFYHEIIKRHIEEYDIDTYKNLIKILNELRSGYKYYENIFISALGEAVDNYRLIKSNTELRISHQLRHVIDECPDLFYPNNTCNLDILLEISYRYNVNATEILFPYNMNDVIIKFINNDFSTAVSKFTTEISDNISISKYDNKNFSINIKNNVISEYEVDFLKLQFIYQKIYDNSPTSNLDYELIRTREKKRDPDKFRIDSFIKNAIGLYCWDLEKNNSDMNSAYTLYKDYKKSKKECNNVKCFADKVCKTTNEDKIHQPTSDQCESSDSCKSFVTNAKRIMSLNIKNRVLGPSKQKGSTIKPVSKIYLQRRPLSFFRDEQPEN